MLISLIFAVFSGSAALATLRAGAITARPNPEIGQDLVMPFSTR